VQLIISMGITKESKSPVSARAQRGTQFYDQIKDLGRIGEGSKSYRQ